MQTEPKNSLILWLKSYFIESFIYVISEIEAVHKTALAALEYVAVLNFYRIRAILLKLGKWSRIIQFLKIDLSGN